MAESKPYRTLVEAQENLNRARSDFLAVEQRKYDHKSKEYKELQASWGEKMARANATIYLFKNALEGMRKKAGDEMAANKHVIAEAAIGFLIKASNFLTFNVAGLAGTPGKGEVTGPDALMTAHQQIEFAREKIQELVNSGLPDVYKDLLSNAV